MDSTTPALASLATAASATRTPASKAPAQTNGTKAASATPDRVAPDSTLQRDPRSLQFQVDGDRVITTIVDENDNTVVVQIPDADVIRIAKAIDRMQGFLVKEKA